jgi:hypothetical protein
VHPLKPAVVLLQHATAMHMLLLLRHLPADCMHIFTQPQSHRFGHVFVSTT